MALSKKHFLTGKRVVISGGTGFIGSHLLSQILKQDPKDVLLVSRGSDTKRIKQHLSKVKLKTYTSSIEFSKTIINFDADYIFLLGGNADPRISLENPKIDLEHNLMYHFELLQKFQHQKNTKTKIIYISSVAVYGENAKSPLSETDPTIPKSPYGINKLAMEGYLRYYSEVFGIQALSIRLFSTYGPHLYKQVVYDFIKELLHHPNKLIIRGDGSEIRDLSYIEDQIIGILLLAKKANFKGEVYNLGSGEGISIADLAKKIAQLMKIQPKIEFTKEKKEKHHGKVWIADITRIKQLKHKPKVSLEKGLKKTISWIKSV